MDKENYVKRNHHHSHSSPPHLFTQSHTEPHGVLNHSTHFRTSLNSPHTAVQPQKPWSISSSTAPQPILYGAGISNGRPLVPSPAINPMGQVHIRNFTQSSVVPKVSGGGVGMMRVVPLSVLGSQRGTGVYIPRTYLSQTGNTTAGGSTNKHVPRVGGAQNQKMENVTPPPPPPPQLQTQHHFIGGAHISQNEISVGNWRNAAAEEWRKSSSNNMMKTAAAAANDDTTTAAAGADGGMGEEEERLNNEINKLPKEWTY